MSWKHFIFALALLGWAGCSSPPKPQPHVTVLPPPPAEPQPLPPPPKPPPPPVAAPAPAFLTNTWIPWEAWCRYYGFDRPQRLPINGQSRFELRTSQGNLSLAAGSRIASWNGVGFWLGFNPQVVSGQLYLHRLDAQKNLLPLLLNSRSLLSPNAVILIDPGHGGKTPGTTSVSDGRWEKEFTLDWALRLQKLLATNGCKVFLTRSNDVDIALSNRVALADQLRADLFISLHFNSAASNREPCGIETYCTTPQGMPSSVARDFDDNVSAVFPNNAFDDQNLLLAMHLHRALVGAMGATDRTVRRARFVGVLRQQNRPAILIEGGYLSNPKEARRIGDPTYRQRLSEAIARALLEKMAIPTPAFPLASIMPSSEPLGALVMADSWADKDAGASPDIPNP